MRKPLPAFARRLSGLLLFLTALVGPDLRHVAAQDYTHPRQMDLPPDRFVPPNPDSLRMTLANGLTAFIVKDQRVPLVTLRALVDAGAADGAVPGAAEVLAHALQHNGPASMSPAGFATSLENMAAAFAVELTPERCEIAINVPREDAWGALLLLAHLLRDPNISRQDIESVRRSLAPDGLPSGRIGGETRPALYEGSLTRAVERFKNIIYRDHAYGGLRTAAQLDALTVEKVRSFYRKFFVPGNMVICLSGALPVAEAREAFRNSFSDWPAGVVPEHKRAPDLVPAAGRHLYTFRADKRQAWLVLGHELPAVPLEDEAPLRVMNYILGGGHFDTRLFRETRDKRGLTNDDSGFPEFYRRGPGTYSFRTSGRPEVIHLLAELTLREIRKIRAEPVREEELFVAKHALAEGEFEMWFENGDATALTYAREWLRFRSHSYTATFRERVLAVTKADVQAIARKYLHPERMQAVLTGPIEKVLHAENPQGTLKLQDFGPLVQPPKGQ